MCKRPRLTYQGPSHPTVIVIGEQPSIQDDNTGHLFSGEDGVKLRKLFTKVGLKHNEVGYANVIACHYGKKPKMEYVRCCANNLLKELKKHNAKLELVILLGSLANKQILQKTDMASLAGKIHRIHGIYHLPMIEPSKKQSAGKIKQAERDLQKALALINLNIDSVLDWELVDSARLKELKPKLLNANTLTFDCETSSLDMMDATQFIIGVGFCYDTKNRKGCFVPLEHPDLHISCEEYSKRVSLIREILLSGVPVRAFNGGFDLSWVHQFLGIDIDSVNFVSDPRHAHHLIKKSGDSSKLENLTLDYLPDMGGYDAEVDVLKVQHGTNFAHFPLNKIAPYCVGDCVATARLAEEIFDSQLKKIGSWNLYRNIIMPVIPIYDKISMNGMQVDLDYCSRLTDAYKKSLPKLRNICLQHRVLDKYRDAVDLDSPTKMADLLYNKLKLPDQTIFRYKAGSSHRGLSSDKKAIDQLLEDVSVPNEYKLFLRDFRDYSKVSTVNTRYASKWHTWIGWDGLIHPQFNMSGTASGRIAVSNPNMSQLRRGEVNLDTEANRLLAEYPVRRMFVSRFCGGKIVECDFSQIELRIMAALSQDKVMVDTYCNGLNNGDLHTSMAISLHPNFYEVSPDLQTQWRTEAKPHNFKGGYSLDAIFLDAYPGLKKFIEKEKRKAIGQGYVVNVLGRRRVIPALCLPVVNKKVYKMTPQEKSNYYNRLGAIRQAMNHLIQSLAHEVMLTVLPLINREFVKRNLRSKLILEVHDAFVADCPDDEAKEVALLMKEQMESAYDVYSWFKGVPLIVDMAIGDNLQDKKGWYGV